jgi:GABA(A) receptor-associated protein
MSYKEKFTLKNRIEESTRIKEKYPDKLPVIVDKHRSSTAPAIDKNKFLVPLELTLGHFVFIIRKRININPEEALFMFVNDKILPMSTLMSSIYKEHTDIDGFLYVFYTLENTYG